MASHKLVITLFVPAHQHRDGHVFIEIVANLRFSPKNKLEFDFGHPYTVTVSRSETNSFSHGCPSIEAAQKFLEQHRYDIELIAPPGKFRAYYGTVDRGYYYMGRTFRDEPYWRSEESRAAWLTQTEFDVVVAEAARNQWTKDKTILKLARQ